MQCSAILRQIWNICTQDQTGPLVSQPVYSYVKTQKVYAKTPRPVLLGGVHHKEKGGKNSTGGHLGGVEAMV
jgi:hypothetical protein